MTSQRPDLAGAAVGIWGFGKEGQSLARTAAAAGAARIDAVDDAGRGTLDAPGDIGNLNLWRGAEHLARLAECDVVFLSPGIPWHQPFFVQLRAAGSTLSSAADWYLRRYATQTVGVTGTKGKSTTASLIGHILGTLGRQVKLVGNIGVPITEIDNATADYAVIEVSSYQAADFDGICDLAVLTSLFPEHIDWHLSVESYYRDKVNLLTRSRCGIVNRDTVDTVDPMIGASPCRKYWFNDETALHARNTEIFDGRDRIGQVRNPYLARPHNRSNLCAALAAAKMLDIDMAPALAATGDFVALPHRQQELGEIGDVLFVDDSISTIPESTIAALAVYAGRDITLIVGGYDRGVDYGKLIKKFSGGAARVMICFGASGERIHAQARAALNRRADLDCALYQAQSMEDAVAYAKRMTPPGGVVLLSPAAPSYGYYRDFSERGRDFAAKTGLPAPTGGAGR